MIAIIKETKTPIICICNDRQNKKLATLITYTFDIKFNVPQQRDVLARMKMIAENEKLNIEEDTLKHLIASSGGGDFRQLINIMQMWGNSSTDIKSRVSKDEAVMINNFDAAHKLLNCGEKPLEVSHPTFRSKLDLFFIDYDFIPLLVQDCYLNSMGARKDMDDLEAMATAADYISVGD